MSSTDKFDGEELAAVFDEIFDMFSTDESNAQIMNLVRGEPNMYDESDTQGTDPVDIFIIEIGDPTKMSFSTGGDVRTSRTWFLTKPDIAELLDTGAKIRYRGRNYIVRVWEIKNIRGSDLIGYGMMERQYDTNV